MAVIDTVARNIFGISGVEMIGIAVLAVVLIAAWAAIRAVLRIALRIFALGCVTILGIVLALYILFVIIR